MKKTMFFALMIGGFVASFFAGNSLSQEGRQIQTNVDSPLPEIGGASSVSFTDTASTAQVQPNPLRAELVELLKQRVKTMKEEELKAEIARVRKQLAEHTAEKKLEQANTLLYEIVKKYTASRAAKHARRMLQVQNIHREGPHSETEEAEQTSP